MTFHQLAFIADLYIPLLALFTLFSLFGINISVKKKGKTRRPTVHLKAKLFALISCILVTYLVMFIDHALGIWPSFSADYSTHTALALVFVSYFMMQGKLVFCLALCSLLLYCSLMNVQKYHTWLDMMSTIVVLMPLFYYFHKKSEVNFK
tara:strand:+ start:676 stop:1125 length:450 start_codon:yes stop_codon:yes gene_type:complete